MGSGRLRRLEPLSSFKLLMLPSTLTHSGCQSSSAAWSEGGGPRATHGQATAVPCPPCPPSGLWPPPAGRHQPRRAPRFLVPMPRPGSRPRPTPFPISITPWQRGRGPWKTSSGPSPSTRCLRATMPHLILNPRNSRHIASSYLQLHEDETRLHGDLAVPQPFARGRSAGCVRGRGREEFPRVEFDSGMQGSSGGQQPWQQRTPPSAPFDPLRPARG